MILQDISNLELRINKNQELQVGQLTYIGQSENLIKKLNDNEYMFIRKDGVATHIKKQHSNVDLGKIHNEINKKLDYSIQYADDRVVIVEGLLSQNEWIYDLISTNKLMEKEIKKKDSFLAEDQKYDNIIDSISTYINHAKFKNKEDEDLYTKLQKEKLELEQKDKRKKTVNEFDKLNDLIDEIQDFHHKLTKKKFQSDNNTEFVGDLMQRESKGDFTYQEELKDRTKKSKFQYHKEEIPDDYWVKMYPMQRKELIPFYDKDLYNEELNKSIRHHEFRPRILNQMKNEIEELHKYFGFRIKDKTERKSHIEKLKSELGRRDYSIKRKIYTDLKSDYELAKKILTNEFYFQPAKHSTIYEINSDTWYEIENGELVELSRNTVLMSNADTYKGLILNYKDLLDKYSNKQTSDWWALIKDFEDILSNTEFTDEEQFVLDVLFDGYSQKQIEKKFKELDLEGFNQRKISRLINQQIPNKLLNTYLAHMDEWLYTEKIMGNFKKCSKCGEVKLISNDRYFNKDKNRKDGYDMYCKECKKQ